MPLDKGEDNRWKFQISDAEQAAKQTSHPSYFEACERYANAFDAAFKGAKERSEFAFVSTLIRVRGLQDPGWDPYESSLQAIDQMRALHRKADTFEAARHLELWLYGHIIEASEPYEILANLVAICQGDTWRTDRFPPQGNRPQSPGAKIKSLKEASAKAGIPELTTPLNEIWDRELRNAIFHSDYSVHGVQVRFRKDGWPEAYSGD